MFKGGVNTFMNSKNHPFQAREDSKAICTYTNDKAT